MHAVTPCWRVRDFRLDGPPCAEMLCHDLLRNRYLSGLANFVMFCGTSCMLQVVCVIQFARVLYKRKPTIPHALAGGDREEPHQLFTTESDEPAQACSSNLGLAWYW